jgi:hypothetical protein
VDSLIPAATLAVGSPDVAANAVVLPALPASAGETIIPVSDSVRLPVVLVVYLDLEAFQLAASVVGRERAQKLGVRERGK